MAVTERQLALDIELGISHPLENLIESLSSVRANQNLLRLAVPEFQRALSDTIAGAIAKAVQEGVVG